MKVVMKLSCLFLVLLQANAQDGEVSCGSTKCIGRVSAPYIKQLPATTLLATKCCGETQFVSYAVAAPASCGSLFVTSFKSSALDCVKNGELDLAAAQQFCADKGARMCTTAENMADCTKVAKCGLNALFVWAEPVSDSPSVIPTLPPSVLASSVPSAVATPTPSEAGPSPPDGGGHDDPHFYTWGGVLYDYHGVCDMIYTTCPNFDEGKGLHLHVRTEFVEPVKWSTISNIAVKIGDHTFEVQSNGDYYLNGVANADLSEANLSGHVVKRGTRFDQNRLRVLFSVKLNSHAVLEILVKSPKNDGSKNDRTSMSFKMNGGHDHRSAGGDDFSDCVGLSNTWEEPAQGQYLVGRSGELYEYGRAHEFAPEWQVDQDKNDPMLFKEDMGLQLPKQECIKSPILVADKRHLSKFFEADGGSRSLKAQNACGHIDSYDLFDACYFDVLVTGDVTFAEEPWYNN